MGVKKLILQKTVQVFKVVIEVVFETKSKGDNGKMKEVVLGYVKDTLASEIISLTVIFEHLAKIEKVFF